MLAWRRLALLCLAAVALLVLPFDSGAQDDPQGTARIEIFAGYETAYGNYCLPVANAGLGRQTADGGNLEWQLSSNASVVPVFVKISHRQSIAFTGRVEVVSSNPYYPEETPAMHTLTMTREFVAPPGVPITVAMTPRVAPKAAPGRPVTLDVRIYRTGSNKPFATYQVQATQLEPAHVYSLLIANTSSLDPPLASTIDVSKEVTLPKFMVEDKESPYAGLLSFNHYVLPVAQETFTKLPLAARDFAFVCVDGRAAAEWEPDAQTALVQYALAGGYVCLYNAGGLQGSGLQQLNSTHQLGRGYILASDGGFDSARKLMDQWLRGEMQEFGLWMYGSVNGMRLFQEQPDGRYNLRDISQLFLDLRQIYTGPDPTHAAGYLNPIWLYREVCRPGAVEPWDYPEFTVAYRISRPATLRNDRNPLVQNWNLAWLSQQFQTLLVKPLRDLSQPVRARGIDGSAILVITLLICIGAAMATLFPRKGTAAATGSLVCALFLLASWFKAEPAQIPETRLVLIDADTSTKECVQRVLSAQATGSNSNVTFETSDVIRAVRSEQLPDLAVQLQPTGPAGSSAESRVSFSNEGPFTTIASDGVCKTSEAKELPVRLWKTSSADEICVHVDSRKLKPRSNAILFTPEGAEVIPGGVADHQTRFGAKLVNINPGVDRLLGWQAHYRRSGQQFSRFRQGRGFGPWQGAPDSFSMLRLATLDESAFETEDDLSRLGWNGLLQTVGGARAFIGNQCWLYCQLESDSPHEASFLRLTMPLESSGE